MFDFEKCRIDKCDEYSLSGKETCINHIDNGKAYIDELIKKILNEDVHKDIKAAGCSFSNQKLGGRIFNVCNFSKCIFENTDFNGCQFRLCFF